MFFPHHAIPHHISILDYVRVLSWLSDVFILFNFKDKRKKCSLFLSS